MGALLVCACWARQGGGGTVHRKRQGQYLRVTSCTFLLLLINNATTWSPSPSNAHSPRAVHCWLMLVLLNQCWWAGHWSSCRLVRRSWPAAAAFPASQCQCRGVHWQALARVCQAAVNKPYLVFFGSMHVLVHESPAGKPAGPEIIRNLKYVLPGTLSMFSEIVSMCTYIPIKNEINAVPNQEKRSYTCMYPVHTGTYHFMTLKY
jgi:hypothetical protein